MKTGTEIKNGVYQIEDSIVTYGSGNNSTTCVVLLSNNEKFYLRISDGMKAQFPEINVGLYISLIFVKYPNSKEVEISFWLNSNKFSVEIEHSRKMSQFSDMGVLLLDSIGAGSSSASVFNDKPVLKVPPPPPIPPRPQYDGGW